MGRLDTPPAVFLSQSASGYYGDAGPVVLREDAPAGTSVLARICVDWEAAAQGAPAGVRVVTPRTGVVLSRSGGALGRLMPLLRLGVGGPLGNGRQFWPWITLPMLRGPSRSCSRPRCPGPVNVCAPESADVNSLISQLARALHSPALLRVPAPVLRLVMGKLAEELLLASQRMDPAALSEAGFQWQHPSLAQAAAWVAGTGLLSTGLGLASPPAAPGRMSWIRHRPSTGTSTSRIRCSLRLPPRPRPSRRRPAPVGGGHCA